MLQFAQVRPFQCEHPQLQLMVAFHGTFYLLKPEQYLLLVLRVHPYATCYTQMTGECILVSSASNRVIEQSLQVKVPPHNTLTGLFRRILLRKLKVSG